MTIPELKELNEQIPSMDCTALQCALRETVSQLTEILSAMETSSEAQKEMLRQFQEMKETCKTQKHEIDRLNRLVNRLSGQLCIEKNTIFGRKTEQADDVTHSVLSGAVPEDPVSDTQHADETEAPDPDASAPVQRKRKS
jgi:chromosome segregation ATPase